MDFIVKEIIGVEIKHLESLLISITSGYLSIVSAEVIVGRNTSLEMWCV
jgi:hypothetical protein